MAVSQKQATGEATDLQERLMMKILHHLIYVLYNQNSDGFGISIERHARVHIINRNFLQSLAAIGSFSEAPSGLPADAPWS